MVPHDPPAARELLRDFALRTGLDPHGGALPRRYLWTDAFAVSTLVALHAADADRESLEAALRLVDQVHSTLGRHRPDGPRPGWLSGLDEAQGRTHPTARGLRIGKPLPERGPDEPLDEHLEWERDGQYFHYLTRWMQALACVARVDPDGPHLRHAVELARAAHAGFTVPGTGGAPPRMIWKASVDLTRPQVASMGAQDPLDGLVTFRGLRAQALEAGWSAADVGLDGAVADMRAMCARRDWATPDPLGIGGLLTDALRLARLGERDPADSALVPRLLDGAADGLAELVWSGQLHAPASRRLAFRELGLAIGLCALPRLARLVAASHASAQAELEARLESLRPFAPLAEAVVGFWTAEEHRAVESWHSHEDINAVMLAASLVPEGVLDPCSPLPNR